MDITCQLLGGLGNMMFGLATTYAVGLEKKLTPCIHLDHKGYLHTHPSNYTSSIFRKFKLINDISNFHLYNEPSFTYTPISIPSDVNIKLNGYFQCEKYFMQYREEILDLFSPTDDIKSYINTKYSEFIHNNTVSIHVRRGNYINLSHIHPPCNLEYYYSAITNFKNCKFLIFSDDINYCKQSFIGDKFYFVENESDLIDMYLMSMCKHNIMSNSTFSWWGSWLNTNGGKVIYPKKWFNGKIYTSVDICPERWIKL